MAKAKEKEIGALRQQRTVRRFLRRLENPGSRGFGRRPETPGDVHRLHRRAGPPPPGL